MTKKIKVLELFSGIGGMHYALDEAKKHLESNFDFEIVRAIDISDVANQVYKHNFPSVEVKESNICGLTPEMLKKLEVNAIFMSPPCQPFTRQGNQKDLQDNRTQPFVHIVQDLIPNYQGLDFILMENVKGFESSQAHEMLIQMLKSNDFCYEEFLICPKQLGIPNSRLRYYLIASKFPGLNKTFASDVQSISDNILTKFKLNDCRLSSIINDTSDPFDKSKLALDSKTLLKHAQVFDIVDETSQGTCCFTKSYGKYAEGTGSVLQQGGDLEKVFQDLSKMTSDEEKLAVLRTLKLRYFTPFEVAKLLGFPTDTTFTFPTSHINKPILSYRVLGNSLNVKVVAMLSVILFNKTLVGNS